MTTDELPAPPPPQQQHGRFTSEVMAGGSVVEKTDDELVGGVRGAVGVIAVVGLIALLGVFSAVAVADPCEFGDPPHGVRVDDEVLPEIAARGEAVGTYRSNSREMKAGCPLPN